MKNITITLTGEGPIYWFGNIIDMDNFDEDENIFDLEENEIIEGIQELSVITDEVKVYIGDEYDGELILKKGKYLKTKEYFTGVVKNPCYVVGGNTVDIVSQYTIELNDDEEFDPMKLQLVKSDYELDFVPYGIIWEYIYYDGKKIEVDDPCSDNDVEEDNWNTVIDYELPYT